MKELRVCDVCKHRKDITNKLGQTFELCRNECGRYCTNSGHPLAPCSTCEAIYDDEGAPLPEGYPEGNHFCEVDEDAIREGHRCSDYCTWLYFMHRYMEAD